MVVPGSYLGTKFWRDAILQYVGSKLGNLSLLKVDRSAEANKSLSCSILPALLSATSATRIDLTELHCKSRQAHVT